MKILDIKELKEIIQSGHLNLLIGSGCSLPYIKTLGNIELEMNDSGKEEAAKKEYYTLIKKSKSIISQPSISLTPGMDMTGFFSTPNRLKEYDYDSSTGMLTYHKRMTLQDSEDLKMVFTDSIDKTKIEEHYALSQTKQNYRDFLNFWASTLTKRSLHIVNKQVNIFTTNFDLFMEDACENLGVPYNDGFSGQIKPVFKVSNFNKIQKYKSLQFDNTSDIPLLNIIKLHGSVSWRAELEDIIYSDGSHIADDLESKSGSDFMERYNEIAVINPNAEKHFETVLNTNYASMLRKFALELEKENSVVMIFGFSLADRHIRDLLYGVMKTNPTLVVIYFSYSKYDDTSDTLEEGKNPNLYVLSPEANFSFEKNITYLSSVLFSVKKDKEDETD